MIQSPPEGEIETIRKTNALISQHSWSRERIGPHLAMMQTLNTQRKKTGGK